MLEDGCLAGRAVEGAEARRDLLWMISRGISKL